MKLGVAISKEKDLLPSEIAKRFYDQGIKNVELTYTKYLTFKEVKKINNFDLNLSIHCPFKDLRLKYSIINLIFKMPSFYFLKSQIKEMEKGLSIAEKLKATHYVMHGGIFPKGYFRFKELRKTDKFVEVFIKTFKPLFIKAKDNGIKIVLENLTTGNFFSDISDILKVQEEYPELGFCLDFGHSEMMQQTSRCEGLKIDHVHVSDNDLVTDLHMALGQGKIDVIKLKGILDKQKFRGKVLAECLNVKDAMTSFEYLKRHFK